MKKEYKISQKMLGVLWGYVLGLAVASYYPVKEPLPFLILFSLTAFSIDKFLGLSKQ